MNRPILAKLDARFAHLAARPILAAVVIALLSAMTSTLPAIVAGALPQPTVHDEFSYLLAADTFLHGRLTNPTPPMWRFFQTFHELMTPTYMSKYPPGQGLFLALGTLLFGQPIAGVWISAVLASVAIFWMLGAWFPPRWAFFGGVLTATAFTSAIGWTTTYMGGSVAQLGAALVWGGVGRLTRRRPRTLDGILAALGLAIGANSRPLESAAATLPAIILLTVVTIRCANRRQLLARGWGPIVIILIGTILWMGHYNHVITGNAFELPYQRYTSDYDVIPVFYWQPLRHHPLNDPHINSFYEEWTLNSGEMWIEPIGRNWLRLQTAKLTALLPYIGVLGYFPVLLIPFALFRKGARWWAVAVALVITAALCSVYANTRYYSSISCLIVALAVTAMRELFARRRLIKGLAVVGMLIGAGLNIGVQCVKAFDDAAKATPEASGLPAGAWLNAKPLVARWIIDHSSAASIVFVNYDPPIWSHFEWVYNSADIDSSPLIWARDRGATKNQELIRFYPNRSVWKITIDSRVPAYQLTRY